MAAELSNAEISAMLEKLIEQPVIRNQKALFKEIVTFNRQLSHPPPSYSEATATASNDPKDVKVNGFVSGAATDDAVNAAGDDSDHDASKDDGDTGKDDGDDDYDNGDDGDDDVVVTYEFPAPETVVCPECNGQMRVFVDPEYVKCERCNGYGDITKHTISIQDCIECEAGKHPCCDFCLGYGEVKVCSNGKVYNMNKTLSP